PAGAGTDGGRRFRNARGNGGAGRSGGAAAGSRTARRSPGARRSAAPGRGEAVVARAREGDRSGGRGVRGRRRRHGGRREAGGQEAEATGLRCGARVGLRLVTSWTRDSRTTVPSSAPPRRSPS